MAEWSERLDAFLTFNDRDVLTHAGKVGADDAKRVAHERFLTFDTERRNAEDSAAEDEHLREILRLTNPLKPDRS